MLGRGEGLLRGYLLACCATASPAQLTDVEEDGRGR